MQPKLKGEKQQNNLQPIHLDLEVECKDTELISFSADLWNKCLQLQLPQTAVRTAFIQGLNNGTLSVDYYGAYMVQDVAYLKHGSETWAYAANQAIQQNKVEIAKYCVARSQSWDKYAKYLGDKYHVKPTGIMIGDAAQQYIQYEKNTVAKYGAEYSFVVFYACVKLWPYIANKLKIKSQNDDNENENENLYQFWIDGNLEDKSAVRNEKWLNQLYNEKKIDKELSTEIVCNCLKLEINFFKEACKEKRENIILFNERNSNHENQTTKNNQNITNVKLPQIFRARSV